MGLCEKCCDMSARFADQLISCRLRCVRFSFQALEATAQCNQFMSPEACLLDRFQHPGPILQCKIRMPLRADLVARIVADGR